MEQYGAMGVGFRATRYHFHFILCFSEKSRSFLFRCELILWNILNIEIGRGLALTVAG
jgi:hypothetical protein